MERIYFILYNLVFKPILKLYLKTDSNIRFDGFKLKIFKEVFHPKLFFSTKYFYSFLKKQNLSGKRFLEIGCGSGILSMLALRMGATVTAVDIDEKAVENTKLNFAANFESTLKYEIIQSDLFNNLQQQQFDYIAINPPYYFKSIQSASQYAWYCGENGEYFQKLFQNLANYMNPHTHVYMILEENCEIDRIKAFASRHNLQFELIEQKKIRWERNFIFKIYSK